MKTAPVLDAYWSSIRRSVPLTPAQERVVFARLQTGDPEARATLVCANLRFVVQVARQYEGNGLTLEELISEGNEGLILAAQNFDPTRGFRFITYAVWWIRQRIGTALRQGRYLVPVPVSRLLDLKTILRAQDTYAAQHDGAHLDAEGLAEHCKLSRERVYNALGALCHGHCSLDEPLPQFESASESWLDRLPSDDAPPDADLERAELLGLLRRQLRRLPEREQTILACYFGLGDHQPHTLEQIGLRLGLTRERVRQLRDRALGNLAQDMPERLSRRLQAREETLR